MITIGYFTTNFQDSCYQPHKNKITYSACLEHPLFETKGATFYKENELKRFSEIVYEFGKQLPQINHDISDVIYRWNLIDIAMVFAKQNQECFLEDSYHTHGLEYIIEKWIEERKGLILHLLMYLH